MELEFDTQTCKMLVTKQSFGALYVMDESSDSMDDDGDQPSFSSLHLEGQMPCRLQVIQTNSALMISSALRDNTAKTFLNNDIFASFQRVVDVVCSDSYAGNFAAEKILSEQDRLQFPSVAWTQRLKRQHQHQFLIFHLS